MSSFFILEKNIVTY